MFQGAADVYRFVAATALGKETPESRDKAREGKDVVRLLADVLRDEGDLPSAGARARRRRQTLGRHS